MYHILTQYLWPDSAPTGLYAEDLAARLLDHGAGVRLVGGRGRYRTLAREKPLVPIVHLEHYDGRRGSFGQTLREYASVERAFARYIEEFVRSSDVVVVTSAPPNTVRLAERIKSRGASAIYWLQDYYPELVRGIHEYPTAMRRAFSRYWDKQLLRWDRVVKIGANLSGPSRNSTVIRNWPTLKFEWKAAPEPKTALYSGNLGYGHDVSLLVAACERLRDEGYRIDIRADGRGLRQLPGWLRAQPLHSDPQLLKEELVRHEIHLVAAHPEIQGAVFPSKIWNSLALGRELVCTGFEGAMLEELEASRNSPFDRHIEQWMDLLLSFRLVAQPMFAVAA